MEQLSAEIMTATWKAVYNDDEKTGILHEEKFGKLDEAVKEIFQIKSRSQKDIKVEDSYTGPRLEGNQVTKEFISELMKSYEGSTPQKLHYVYAKKIISEVKEIFQKHKALVSLSVPEGGHLTVVGDTHGQLIDVLTIFQLRGYPSDSNIFLFNGDFVDRGPHGVELLLLLYSLKVFNPNSIYLNRGNHENRRMNSKYSFEDQVLERYDVEIYELIQDTFIQLPLATVINKQVLVVHGGLFGHENVTLKEIKKINFRMQLPRHAENTTREQQIMEQLLWSDPKEIEGWENSSRGAGVHFGPKVTEQFLQQNNLSLLIRSHECEGDGYRLMHNDKVVTIFSASYYGGDQQNKGAVIVFNDEKPLTPKFEQFLASALAFDGNQAHPIKDFERVTIQRLYEKIFELRQPLLLEFSKRDIKGDGLLELQVWEEVLLEVTELKIAWISLIPYLAKNENEFVCYMKFLDRFKVTSDKSYFKKWKKGVCAEIAEKLAGKYKDIKLAFKAADTDSNGSLSYSEFLSIIQSLSLSLSDPQIYDLMQSADKNYSGTIDLNEFTQFFRPKSVPNEEELIALRLLGKVNKAVRSRGKLLGIPKKDRDRDCFLHFTEDNSKHVTYSQFRRGLRKVLQLEFEKSEVNALSAVVDKNHSKSISIAEFNDGIKRAHDFAKEKKWKENYVQNTLHSLFSSRHQLKRAFRTMDVDNSGSVTLAEFEVGIKALNSCLDNPISHSEIKQLFLALDANGDGTLDYTEFLSSLRVVDSKV